MDGEEIAITVSVNILTILGMVYYMRGYMKAKFEDIKERLTSLENNQKENNKHLYKYIDARIEDLKEYVKTKFDSLYKLFNTRVKNIEEIVYKQD